MLSNLHLVVSAKAFAAGAYTGNPMSVSQLVWRMARRLGYDIHRTSGCPEAQLAKALRINDVSLVLDVGANTGQFARALLRAGYRGRILSFEPQARAHTSLMESSRHYRGWTVGPRVAIGNHRGRVTLNLSKNSVSSSILPVRETCVQAAPASRYIGSEEVEIFPLDDVAPLRSDDRIFLKIDVQGYTSRVLDGAPRILHQVRGLQVELSLLPLYDGEALFADVLSRLSGTGLELWQIFPGLRDFNTARLLECDAVFFRPLPS